MKSAIVYCSNKGTTEKLAKKISRDFSADMFKVEPAEDYGSFFAAVARVAREKRAKMSAADRGAGSQCIRYRICGISHMVWNSTCFHEGIPFPLRPGRKDGDSLRHRKCLPYPGIHCGPGSRLQRGGDPVSLQLCGDEKRQLSGVEGPGRGNEEIG